MNVSLTPQIVKWIAAEVKTGRYTGASELLREAVRRLMDYQITQDVAREKLEAAIDEAHESIQRGEGIGPEEWKKRNAQRRAQWLKKHAPKAKAA